ncbi:MAG: glycosyltransferase [Herpetosiphonaceae bacterium]|nr:glycosyltransferase [Herpetosiphonaceae bacterium]
MTTSFSCSVIIPSLNSPLIGQVVASVALQSSSAMEIIVVGRDQLGLLQNHAGCVFLDTDQPISPAAARNIGARHATGEILCFLDADCIADEAWLERLVQHHRAGAQVVGGGVRFEDQNYWTVADNIVSFADFLACTAPGLRTHLPSLNWSIRRTLFHDSGGFDERFPQPAGEDTELSFRLRRMGQRLFFAPEATVRHCPARSTAHALWHHLRRFGATYGAIQEQYNPLLGRSLRVRLSHRHPYLVAVLAPLLAVLDTATTCRHHPCLLRYWYAMPGIVWGRLAWYSGLIFGIERAS